MKNNIILLLLAVLFITACASKKEILYFNDAKTQMSVAIDYTSTLIQHNDILSIQVMALVPETAIPYNVIATQTTTINVEQLKLSGYLVSKNGSITFPVLGELSVAGQTLQELQDTITTILADDGHLVSPIVKIRLLNAKVTILGEVNAPGTYSFTEQNITLPQALGYARDLTINGKRTDVLLIREENGVRKITHIDLTAADLFSSPYYHIKQNDVIIVNPNIAKVKTAGFVGNIGTILTIASLMLSSVILLTR